MGFLNKNKDVIVVAILTIWINFFPSNNPMSKDTQRSSVYALINTNSHLYPYTRYLVPLIGVIAIMINRTRRKDDE